MKFIRSSYKGVVAPEGLNETEDCSVRSVANAAGIFYRDSWEIMKNLGRIQGKPMNVRMAAAGAMRAGGKLFICESLEDYRLKDGTYVVFMQQHSFCLKDNQIIDTIKPDLSEKLLGIFKY